MRRYARVGWVVALLAVLAFGGQAAAAAASKGKHKRKPDLYVRAAHLLPTGEDHALRGEDNVLRFEAQTQNRGRGAAKPSKTEIVFLPTVPVPPPASQSARSRWTCPGSGATLPQVLLPLRRGEVAAADLQRGPARHLRGHLVRRRQEQDQGEQRAQQLRGSRGRPAAALSRQAPLVGHDLRHGSGRRRSDHRARGLVLDRSRGSSSSASGSGASSTTASTGR